MSQIGGPLAKEKEAECRQAGWTGGKGGGTGKGGLIYFFNQLRRIHPERTEKLQSALDYFSI